MFPQAYTVVRPERGSLCVRLEKRGSSMYFCSCKGITDWQVREVAESGGIATIEQLIQALGLDDKECCGKCARQYQRLMVLANLSE